MPGEIITLQTGQCGNQTGSRFWQQLCAEHGILPDGTGVPADFTRDDQTDIFFQQDDNNRYTPRAILVDMEPRVVNDITRKYSMFNSKNVHLAANGGGAGNIWAQGFQYGQTHIEELLDIIDKEMDSCDSMEGFQLIHSVAGGTGSGVGSKLLELLSDRYPKKIKTTFSVFPGMDQTSDVVVQPYNTVLTLNRLIENSDCSVVFDNSALLNIASKNLQIPNPSFDDTNQLISTVMSGFTNTVRFPSYSFNSITSLVSSLVPTTDLHFVIPSFTPFTSDFVTHAKEIRRSTLYDVMLELLDKKLKMVKSDQGANIAVMDILQGDIEQSDIEKLLTKVEQRMEFVPWTSSSINIAILKRSKFFQNKSQVSGLMLSNSTSILQLLNNVVSQYDRLISRQAFVESYKKYDYDRFDIMDEFENSRELVESLIEDYTNSESMKFLEDDEDDDGDEMMQPV